MNDIVTNENNGKYFKIDFNNLLFNNFLLSFSSSNSFLVEWSLLIFDK